ncbi:MAG: ribose-5-phosphate isomerase A, partial [Alcaligenaceae bacterium]
RGQVARVVQGLGGVPVLRKGFTTDNGNQILDVQGLSIVDPLGLEQRLNQVPGVVTNGLFAVRSADVALLATQQGIRQLKV